MDIRIWKLTRHMPINDDMASLPTQSRHANELEATTLLAGAIGCSNIIGSRLKFARNIWSFVNDFGVETENFDEISCGYEQKKALTLL